jgi:hypothetical protein
LKLAIALASFNKSSSSFRFMVFCFKLAPHGFYCQ